MKYSVPTTIVMVGALLTVGCATRKYVRNTVSPVDNKVDQVAQQVAQQGQTLDKTNQTLDQTRQQQQKNETELSALNERVMSVDTKAGQAMQRADQANSKADQNAQSLAAEKQDIANLDNFKPVGTASVFFKTGSSQLSRKGQQQLDQMAANPKNYQRYIVTIEGFTDNRGSAQSNMALSRHRADAVVAYLVTKGVPIWRISTVGLGEVKPGQRENHEALAQARRCTITVLAADTGATPATTASTSTGTTDTASVADTDDATPTAQGNGGDEVNTQQPR
jgi:OOP family OmpA-OmpF porin